MQSYNYFDYQTNKNEKKMKKNVFVLIISD